MRFCGLNIFFAKAGSSTSLSRATTTRKPSATCSTVTSTLVSPAASARCFRKSLSTNRAATASGSAAYSYVILRGVDMPGRVAHGRLTREALRCNPRDQARGHVLPGALLAARACIGAHGTQPDPAGAEQEAERDQDRGGDLAGLDPA